MTLETLELRGKNRGNRLLFIIIYKMEEYNFMIGKLSAYLKDTRSSNRLARHLGVSAQTISNWISGRSVMSAINYLLIIEFLREEFKNQGDIRDLVK